MPDTLFIYLFNFKQKPQKMQIDKNLHGQSTAPWLHKMLHMWGHKLWANPCKPSQCDCTVFYKRLVDPLFSQQMQVRMKHPPE